MLGDAATPSLGAVFGRSTTTRSSSSIALVAALASHGLLFAFTGTLRRTVPTSSPSTSLIVVTHEVDLAPRPEPEPPPPPAPAPDRPSRADRVAPTAAPQEAAPAAATAANVVAAAPDAETLDFSNDIVQGNSATYAGGTTRSDGTSTTPVLARGVGTGGTGTNATSSSRARSARLPARSWRCVLSAGGDLGERPMVALRVVVDASGRATSVAVVDAPSSSVGNEAAACARRTRFEPARDEHGDAIASTLPLLNVRVTTR